MLSFIWSAKKGGRAMKKANRTITRRMTLVRRRPVCSPVRLLSQQCVGAVQRSGAASIICLARQTLSEGGAQMDFYEPITNIAGKDALTPIAETGCSIK
jgi:hypothetical protein